MSSLPPDAADKVLEAFKPLADAAMAAKAISDKHKQSIQYAAEQAAQQFDYIVEVLDGREPYPNMLAECKSRANELRAAIVNQGGVA